MQRHDSPNFLGLRLDLDLASFCDRRGIGVGVKGVAGRDAIVHRRQRNGSHKELVAKRFPRFSSFSLELSGSHRSTHIASDLASQVLASQAKPQRESESQAFRIARS